MAKAGSYKLLRGTKTRIEGGKVRIYRPGDIMELDEREAAVLALSVEPVRKAAMRTGPAVDQEVSTIADADTPADARAEFIDAPAAVVAKRIANLDDDGTLERLADAESEGKGRKTVFRAIEDRRAELAEGEDS